MTRQICRCEGSISPSVLEGYACGNPDCWRTDEAKRSFEAFVAELIRKRGDGAPLPVDVDQT